MPDIQGLAQGGSENSGQVMSLTDFRYIIVSERLSPADDINHQPTIIAVFQNCFNINICLWFKKENNFMCICTKHGITYLRQNEKKPATSVKIQTDLVAY